MYNHSNTTGWVHVQLLALSAFKWTVLCLTWVEVNKNTIISSSFNFVQHSQMSLQYTHTFKVCPLYWSWLRVIKVHVHISITNYVQNVSFVCSSCFSKQKISHQTKLFIKSVFVLADPPPPNIPISHYNLALVLRRADDTLSLPLINMGRRPSLPPDSS